MNHDATFLIKSLGSAVRKASLLWVITSLLTPAVFGTPAVKLSTASGPPTSNVKISGSGFPASRFIDLYFDTTDLVLVVSSATGTFSNIPLQVPAKARPGTHWVTAVVRASGLTAQKSFVVRTNWERRGFTPDNKRFNGYENVLNPFNVGSIDLHWSFFNYSRNLSSPAVANGVVYVRGGLVLYALDASTGANLWISWGTNEGSEVHSSPAVANGVVYVGTDYSSLLAIDARTGAMLWNFLARTPEDFSAYIESSPTVANGVVYVGSVGNFFDENWGNVFTDGQVYALNAKTGEELWSFPTNGAVISSPAVANGVVYVGSEDFNLYALSARTGAKLWSYPTGAAVHSSPAVANGVVYVGSDDANVYALNAHTGTKLWSFRTGKAVESSPAVANGIVYVGSDDGRVYALDASTGLKLWSLRTSAPVISSPAVANGVVYVGSEDFNLYALSARTGAKLWSYPTAAAIDSSPAVADGVIYVGSSDSNVYAFDLAGGILAKPQSAERPNSASLVPDYSLSPSNR